MSNTTQFILSKVSQPNFSYNVSSIYLMPTYEVLSRIHIVFFSKFLQLKGFWNVMQTMQKQRQWAKVTNWKWWISRSQILVQPALITSNTQYDQKKQLSSTWSLLWLKLTLLSCWCCCCWVLVPFYLFWQYFG